jgi:PAS domain S-box-containing protein
VLFNRAAERIYGTTAKDMLGRHVSSLYPEGGAANVMKLIREGGGRVEGLRIDVVDNEGALVPVAFSGALIFDRDSAVGSVGIFTDLREKMRMEQRLHRAQEQLIAQERQAAIAELAGAAAHELNQPLTSVMNYATLLKRVLEKDTSAYNAADVIETESARMADIVRKIGKITKYETKSYVGTQKILDLDKASEASSISLEKRTSIPPSGRSIGEKD